MTFKEKIYQYYLQLITEKTRLLQKSLQDLTESAGNETKRTAGDKHETALAMLQIEQENISRQLKESFAQKSVLEKIDPTIHTEQIVRGSLVFTNKGLYYISLGLGKLNIENETVFAVSPEAQLGKLLLTKKAGDVFSFNNYDYKILQID